MLYNFSISQLSLSMILVAPFITQSHTFENNLINTFFKINCINFFHPFLFSHTNSIIYFKESSFSKFHGQSPIFINTIDFDMKYTQKHINEEINDPIDHYDQKEFINSLYFAKYTNISTTFTNCKFYNCYNQLGPGGAISYRKDTASLNIYSCQFFRCSAQYNAGAIFIQVSDGGWMQGDASITNSVFEECYDCNQNSNYVAGVFEAFIAKGQKHFSFSLIETHFKNCQFDSENKITEGQMRLNANIFHINYDNITNNNEKIDASAFLFVKYVQEPSTLSFINGINQRGFTFFEIYDLQSNFIHAYNINMVNSTFTMFNKDSVMSKIAFFNVYFNIKNCFFLDTLCIIDFIAISTDQSKSGTDQPEPVIFKYADNSVAPITYNIFSNKKFSDQNKINYTLVQDIKFDDGAIIDLPKRIATPTASPLPTISPKPTKTPTYSPTVSQSPTPPQSPTAFYIGTEELPNNSNNNNNNSQTKKKIKGEVIAGIAVGAIVVISILIIIVAVVLQKKRNKSSEEYIKTDDCDTNDIESNAEIDETDSNVCYQNNKFWKKCDPLNMKNLINTLNNYESSNDADDEDEAGGDQL